MKKYIEILKRTQLFSGVSDTEILNCKPRCSFVSRDATL